MPNPNSLSSVIDSLIARRGGLVVDLLLVLSLVLYVAGVLALRKVTTLCFTMLMILAVIYAYRNWPRVKAPVSTAWGRVLIGALASLFVVTLTAMTLRGQVDPPILDGPSRYLFAGLLLLYFRDKGVRFAWIFSLAAPIGLVLGLVAALANPEVATRWGGRLATPPVDPNTLGSYSVILTFMVLLTIDAPGRNGVLIKALRYSGVLAGVLLATLAASRGGWLAVVPLLLLWAVFRMRHGLKQMTVHGLLVLIVVALGLVLIPGVGERARGSAGEVRGWVDGSNTETAAGQRLSIWKLGVALFAEKPIAGYGGPGVREQLALPESSNLASPTIKMVLLEGGPHNDLLGMLLGSGILGLVSFVLLLFVPMLFFWRHRLATDPEVRLACELGVCFTAGIFVCGLTNEMLSLKYLASFYGITVAGLAGQVLAAIPPSNSSPRPNNPD